MPTEAYFSKKAKKMKELSIKEISLVVGAGRGESSHRDRQMDRAPTGDKVRAGLSLGGFFATRTPWGLAGYTTSLNVGEDEFLDNMRRNDDSRHRNGHNDRDGNYRREGGGRAIEH